MGPPAQGGVGVKYRDVQGLWLRACTCCVSTCAGLFRLGLQGTYWAPGDVLRFRVVETACEELCTVESTPCVTAARRGVAYAGARGKRRGAREGC